MIVSNIQEDLHYCYYRGFKVEFFIDELKDPFKFMNELAESFHDIMFTIPDDPIKMIVSHEFYNELNSQIFFDTFKSLNKTDRPGIFSFQVYEFEIIPSSIQGTILFAEEPLFVNAVKPLEIEL
jgi:hypothetical protein